MILHLKHTRWATVAVDNWIIFTWTGKKISSFQLCQTLSPLSRLIREYTSDINPENMLLIPPT